MGRFLGSIAAICSVGAVVSAGTARAEAYTSASYAQEGLIAQWDAIDNAGTGVHDPAATVWKDLKGSRNLTLTNGACWKNGDRLVVNGLGAFGTSSVSGIKTIEVLFRMTRNDGRILFNAGYEQHRQFVVFDKVLSNGNIIGNRCYFSGKKGAHNYVEFRADAAAMRYMAGTFSDSAADATALYGDGVPRIDGTLSNDWYTGDGVVMVGDRAKAQTTYRWYGEVSSIRLYDRELTAEEIASNHAIDLARFRDKANTSADYVQDGLLVQWDGIDNAGTGVHDPAATVWKNLKGGGYDLKLTNNAAWNAEGSALVANGLSAIGTTAAPEYKTIEVVFKRATSDGRILFHGGRVTQFVIFDNAGSGKVRAYFTGKTQNDHSVTTKYVLQPFYASEINFLAARYDDDDVVTDVFKDANQREDGARGNSWYTGSKINIGARLIDSSVTYAWSGEVYAIRLYGRRLTKAELAHNHRIDCRRFLNSSSYIQEGLTAHWDGIDNAGRGLHDSTTNVWKNLVDGGMDLTVGTGEWTDSSLTSFGKSEPAATGTSTLTFTSLETVCVNARHDASAMLFSSGVDNRFLAIGGTHVQWLGTAGSTNYNRYTEGRHALSATVSGSTAAYVDGLPAHYASYENWWGAGTNYVQVGARIADGLSPYPFNGDFFVIRAYSNALSAEKAAYNYKIDRRRFDLAVPSFTWNPEAGDGFFCTNGNWTANQKSSQSVPGASDAATLPAGDYTATLDDEWVLDSLSIGAGATLRIALPVDVDGAARLTVVNGIEADAAAGLELDAEEFNGEHPRQSVTLIECETDSAAALQVLADSLNSSLGRVRATVEDGTRLVYVAPPPSGIKIIVR